MDDFNLRRLVREVLGSTTMTDPTAIAVEVDRRIGDEDCRAALRQALRSLVRLEITRVRKDGDVPPPEPEVVSNVTPIVSGGVPVPTQAARPKGSAKVAAIREMGAAKLRELMHVGEGEWRRLGDCSFADLMFAAAERHELASRNTARAVWFEELAEAVRAAGVERVRDLPTEVLRARLGDVAA